MSKQISLTKIKCHNLIQKKPYLKLKHKINLNKLKKKMTSHAGDMGSMLVIIYYFMEHEHI